MPEPVHDRVYSGACAHFTMPVDHYENFPVASLLLPARLREPVEAIYTFARSADDIADEGNAPAAKRLARLDEYRRELDAIAHAAHPQQPHLAALFTRLGAAVRAFDLPLQPFNDLLDAFSQDVGKTRYSNFAELNDYCRRSANPVGCLLLHLYDAASTSNLSLSNDVCTGLQLINFLQDVAIDHAKQRIYLPLDELGSFGVTEAMLAEQRCDTPWCALMAYQVARARALMLRGAPLAKLLPGRIGWELRLIVLGGLRILERIEQAGYDVFHHRPTLTRSDWMRLAWRALRYQTA